MASFSDPRVRQTFQNISRNIETANERTQEGIYTFSHNFIDPCFSGIKNCVASCATPCFPSREDQLRRKRGRSRGRAELNFDFYNDWDDEDDTGDGLLGWGNDELDRLLAGSAAAGGRADQPRRQRTMNYGSRGRRVGSGVLPNDGAGDPTIIPSSSFLGFLDRLPWKISGRGLRYKPSAADLQDHPGGGRGWYGEREPLVEASDESDAGDRVKKQQTRKRSDTTTSRSTTNSLSSRGDIIPSDEEEDAVPLDDEFAMALERRGTGLQPDDRSSGKAGSGRRPGASRASTKTSSSRDTRTTRKGKRIISTPEAQSPHRGAGADAQMLSIPSMADLKDEEEQARVKEEVEVERKRLAAQMLASQRGLIGVETGKESPQPPSTNEPEEEVTHNSDHEWNWTLDPTTTTSSSDPIMSPEEDAHSQQNPVPPPSSSTDPDPALSVPIPPPTASDETHAVDQDQPPLTNQSAEDLT